MVNFDVAVGGTQDVFNNLLQQIYPVLQKAGLLTFTVDVNQLNVKSATIDIQQAPTVDFNSPPADHLLQHYHEVFSTYPGLVKLQPKVKSDFSKQMLALIDNVDFTMNVPQLSVTINYEDGSPPTTIPNASLVIGAVVSIESGTTSWTVRIQGASAKASTGDPIIDELFNKAIVPFALDYLNKNILIPISIPDITVLGVTLATPVPVIQQGFGIAYSALGNTSPDIPAPSSAWPTDGVFVSLDSNLITAAGNAAIANLNLPSGSISYDLGPLGSITGGYNINLGPLSNVVVNIDGSLSAAIGLYAGASCTWHTPNYLPNVDFSASTSGGGADATLSASVVQGSLIVTFQGLNNINLPFSFSAGGVSLPFLDVFSSFLVSLIAPVIAQSFAGQSFNVYTIPTIHIPLGPGINISLPTVGTEEVTDAGNALLVAHGQPVIS